jgi:hypothetical protein
VKGQPFVPAKLDDYGLSLAEFRLVCHVSRRGISNEAIPNIARVCRMDTKTVKRCIKKTVRLNILHREFRRGDTLILKLRPIAEWQPSPKDTPAQTAPEVVKRPYTSPKGHPDHQAQTTPHKGNPSEGNPMKGDIAPPTFEPVKRGLFRREYEGMIRDAEAEQKKARNEPTFHERVLKKEVAEFCKFLRVEAQSKPEKSAGNLERANAEEKNPVNYRSGVMTAPGNAVVTAWKNRIAEIRAVMNGIKT